MPRFFDDGFSPDKPYLRGEHCRHIGYALRMRPGEVLTICACGVDYECEIASISSDTVMLNILDSAPCCTEPSIRVTLYQALPKSDKLEQIIQKSIELGVTEIVPVLTRRCIARMSQTEFQKKLPRLQKIAQAAAQQSGRGIIPTITPLLKFADAAKRMQEAEVPIVLYEESSGGCSFSAVRRDAKSYAVMIGSEGGFDPEEIAQLREQGVQPVWLGKRILRCETAPLAALSILMFHTGNFDA